VELTCDRILLDPCSSAYACNVHQIRLTVQDLMPDYYLQQQMRPFLTRRLPQVPLEWFWNSHLVRAGRTGLINVLYGSFASRWKRPRCSSYDRSNHVVAVSATLTLRSLGLAVVNLVCWLSSMEVSPLAREAIDPPSALMDLPRMGWICGFHVLRPRLVQLLRTLYAVPCSHTSLSPALVVMATAGGSKRLH
jgi:hypothetical protein